jgi:glycerophosphoryl diester phosphodiesterase
MIIAHRGGVARTKIRENTVQAFERAMSQPNVHGFECDLRLTADDVVVIHHDPDCIARDGGRMLMIEKSRYSELPGYVPTLKDLLNQVAQKNYQGLLNLEVKTYNTIEKVLDIVRRFTDSGKVRPLQILLSSFLHTEVDRLRELGFMRGIIIACQPHCSFSRLMTKADKLILRDSVINWADPTVTSELELVAQDVYLWTVNDRARVECLTAKGFNVITDVIV